MVQRFPPCALCVALLTVRVSPVCLQEAESLVSAVLPPDKQAAAPEVALYLKESVGNATRIDYGTGIGSLLSLCTVESNAAPVVSICTAF